MAKVHLDRGNGQPWCFMRGKVIALGSETEADCQHCFKQRKAAPGPNQILKCSRCHVDKPGAEFHNNSRYATGKNPYCIPCRSEKQSEDRKVKRDVWYAREKRWHDAHPQLRAEQAFRQQVLKPKQVYAISVIRNEVRKGRLQRGPCEVCGDTEYVHGHHDDYDRPLVVRWLCPIHHTEWHEQNGPGANLEGQPELVTPYRQRAS